MLARNRSRLLKERSADGRLPCNPQRPTKAGQVASKGLMAAAGANAKRHTRKPSAELNRTNPLMFKNQKTSRLGSPAGSQNTSTSSKDEEHFLTTQLQNLKREYAPEIDKYLRKTGRSCNTQRALERHTIEPQHRAKMVDWMVEVLSSFRCSDQTFFIAVNIMDRYFKASKKGLHVTELHIVGVIAMFLASKYEDVVPLSIKTVYEKIAHKKLPMEQIFKREIEILEALDFNLMKQNTVFEQMERMAEEHLKGDFKSLKAYYNFYGRLAQFDYQLLNTYSGAELATAALWVAVEALETRKKRRIRCQGLLKMLLEMSGAEEERVNEACEALKDLKKSFSTKFPGMKNLVRFCSPELDTL